MRFSQDPAEELRGLTMEDVNPGGRGNERLRTPQGRAAVHTSTVYLCKNWRGGRPAMERRRQSVIRADLYAGLKGRELRP